MDLVPIFEFAPEWVGAATGVVAMARRRRSDDYFTELRAAGITPEQLLEAVQQSERLGDLLIDATDTAIGCEDLQRRRLLARALAAGIEAGVPIDDAQFFIRSLAVVDPIHMKLLGLIATRGEVSTPQMEQVWPEATTFLKPMRAALDREGIIEDMTLGVQNAYATGSWGLTEYGHRFIDFVRDSGVAIDWNTEPPDLN
jgi:hypothetical protein